MFNLFRRNGNDKVIDRLHGEIMAIARQPAFFVDYNVRDRMEERFELLALHGAVAVRRMEALHQPGPAMAQDLTDAIFRHVDIALRETGVGDLAVPKRMKKMAQSYLGRGVAYRAALEAGDSQALAGAIARNIFAEESPARAPGAAPLAAYAEQWACLLEDAPLKAFLEGPVPAVDAARVFRAFNDSNRGAGAEGAPATGQGELE